MDRLPELLALLYGAGERWTTVSAIGVRWSDRVVSERARERFNARSSSRSRSMMTVTVGDGEPPRFSESEQRFWIARPDRWRTETERHISVGRGDVWWTWSGAQGFVTNEDTPEVGHGSPLEGWGVLLDPGRLLAALRFELVEERDGLLHVGASPAGRDRAEMYLMDVGADHATLDVDPERGIVVRYEVSLEGEPFSRAELRDAVFDEPLDDALFTLEPPPGEPRQSPFGGSEELTLVEAASRASFPVFAFGELPDGPWDLRVRYHAAHRAIAETVSLIYFRRDGRESVTVQEVAHDAEEKLGRGGGQTLLVRRGKTSMLLRSTELDEAVLQRLADTLEPV